MSLGLLLLSVINHGTTMTQPAAAPNPGNPGTIVTQPPTAPNRGAITTQPTIAPNPGAITTQPPTFELSHRHREPSTRHAHATP